MNREKRINQFVELAGKPDVNFPLDEVAFRKKLVPLTEIEPVEDLKKAEEAIPVISDAPAPPLEREPEVEPMPMPEPEKPKDFWTQLKEEAAGLKITIEKGSI